MRLLFVEDAPDYAALVVRHLTGAGFAVDHVPDAEHARVALATVDYDLALLDRRLPDGDALSALPRLRALRPGLRVLFLTALDGLHDRVGGLDAGADDYVVKPVPMAELIARIRASLRRPAAALPEPITCGQLAFDPATRIASVGDVPLLLRRRELALLEALITRAGRVVLRESIEARLFSMDDIVQPNTLDVHVSRLRRRLGDASAGVVIHTVRGVGYMLSA